MVNEEISNAVLSGAKEVYTIAAPIIEKECNEIIESMKKILEQGLKDTHKTSSLVTHKLKDLYKQGQLVELKVNEGDIVDLKRELNNNKVKFSICKDKETGEHTVFYQARNKQDMIKAFENILAKGKELDKPSTIKTLEQAKEQCKRLEQKQVKEKLKEKGKDIGKAFEMIR